ncbi:CD209 antigen-like protein C [Pimephales promelas]|uniref:CD209 antigen-like protein C n=1 Tax=Pimephales promelas TaxID=90988 RepID=UPI0019557F07|nr:CD209 antigen-like protein C [Pimephales promelas]KAG1971031.1 CD209 antigen-like protein C [Pimephales promelas]
MNKENGQTTDVYENDDDIKENDCMSIRCSRAALVCLGLLCVLLVAGVIVLGFLFAQERQLTNYNTDERIQLLTKITNLTQLNAQLNQEKNGLSKNLQERDGWIYYKSSLYFISSETKSWTESRRYCTERGADLIIINNRDEQDFALWKISAGVKLWIGLTDNDVENTWKWVNGSTLTYGFWEITEPNGQARENCVLTYGQGWADYPCNAIFQFICEKIILN